MKRALIALILVCAIAAILWAIEATKAPLPVGASADSTYPYAVGVDVNDDQIAVVLVGHTDEGLFIARHHDTRLPSGTVIQGRIADRPQLIAGLKNLWKELDLPKRQVAFALRGVGTAVLHVELPPPKQGDAIDDIPDEVLARLPFPEHEMNVDAQALIPYDRSAERVRAIVVASQMALVNEWIDAFVGAGLDPVVADLVPFALQNAFELGGRAYETTALLEIGGVVTVNVLSDGRSNYVAHALVEELGTEALVKGALECLSGFEPPLSKILIAGMTEHVEPVRLEIANRTGVPVERFDPSSVIKGPDGPVNVPSAVAVGLGLRAADDD